MSSILGCQKLVHLQQCPLSSISWNFRQGLVEIFWVADVKWTLTPWDCGSIWQSWAHLADAQLPSDVFQTLQRVCFQQLFFCSMKHNILSWALWSWILWTSKYTETFEQLDSLVSRLLHFHPSVRLHPLCIFQLNKSSGSYCSRRQSSSSFRAWKLKLPK